MKACEAKTMSDEVNVGKNTLEQVMKGILESSQSGFYWHMVSGPFSMAIISELISLGYKVEKRDTNFLAYEITWSGL